MHRRWHHYFQFLPHPHPCLYHVTAWCCPTVIRVFFPSLDSALIHMTCLGQQDGIRLDAGRRLRSADMIGWTSSFPCCQCQDNTSKLVAEGREVPGTQPSHSRCPQPRPAHKLCSLWAQRPSGEPPGWHPAPRPTDIRHRSTKHLTLYATGVCACLLRSSILAVEYRTTCKGI